jgi:hypothetical protein
MNFARSREKISGKTCASIFLKVGSKESLMNTEEKFCLRQAEILRFTLNRLGVKLKQTFFST